MNDLTTERMNELEQMLNNETIIKSINRNDVEYLDRATRMPYDAMMSVIEYYRKNSLIINEVTFMNDLKANFHCTEDELAQRFREVHKVRRYKNNKSKEELKIQKKMIKRMNN